MIYSDEQIAILEERAPYVQVIAAAGSGKTSTMIGLLLKILEEGKERADEILVLTFTRKATGEFKERLEKKFPDSGVRIHTFHAYCLSVLQRYDPEYKNSPAQIIDDKMQNQIWREILKEFRFQVGGIPYEFLIGKSETLLDSFFPGLSQTLQKKYKEIKDKRQFLDFDDIVSRYLFALKSEQAWAMRARQELSRIIIDEFQDTDLTQLEWVKLVNPNKLTVVGDDWQAIYGFRGATVKPFLEFENSFPGAVIHFLSTNYRSLPGVVETSSIPITYNKENIKKKVKAHRSGKASIGIIYVSDEDDWIGIRNNFFSADKDSRLLTRTNYRIAKLKAMGFPEDQLLTIHASKGLEFSTVLLDLTDGWTNEEEVNLEEERRILYVGLSRAKDNLFILGKRKYREMCLEKQFVGYFKMLKETPFSIDGKAKI